jgi:hypothetical protein
VFLGALAGGLGVVLDHGARLVLDLGGIAGGDDRVVTCRNDSVGQGATQSGGASGDEPSRHVTVSFCWL